MAWFYGVLVVATAIFGSTVIAASLVGVSFRPGGVYDRCLRSWGRWIVAAAGTPVDVQGLEHVPRGRPVVYASNHTSMFDIFALSAVLPGSVRFVAKQELARVPLFGRAMLRCGNVVIDRFHPRAAHEAYRRAAETIARGASTVVFPEGTRSRTGDLLPFKAMPFGLAIAAGVPLVPVYVHDTWRILPRGAWRLRRRPIHLRIAAPIDTAGRDLDERDALRDAARAAVAECRARVDAVPGAD